MRARFITDTASVNVNPVQVTSNVGVKSGSVEGRVGVKTTVPTNDHSVLRNRDLPDQHPIDSITDLRDILNKLWTFTYEQASPSDTWTINHNLGRHPSVTIVDSSGNVFTPAVSYPTDNQSIVEFNGATTGKAYLN